MSMPFSPCSSGWSSCTDASVKMLEGIFGPIIQVLVDGGSISTLSTAGYVLPTILAFFNSGILVVGSIIVSYVAVVGAVNTANDGEAMGKMWSSVWTPIRIAAGGAVLLPTSSGYSFIQMLALMMALWSAGFANGIYQLGMTTGILKTDNVTSTTVANDVYGMRELGRNYMISAYCAKVANAAFADGSGSPNVSPSAAIMTPSTNAVLETHNWADQNTATNLGGGAAICGSYTFNVYKPITVSASDALAVAKESIRKIVMDTKYNATVSMYQDINSWVNGGSWPTDPNADFSSISSVQLNTIVAKAESTIQTTLQSTITTDTSVSNGLTATITALTDSGWSMAGGWYQRVGMMRKELADVLSTAVGSSSQPSYTDLPEDARTANLKVVVTSVTNKVTAVADASDAAAGGGTNKSATNLASVVPSNLSDLNPAKIKETLDSKMNTWTNYYTEKTVSVLMGGSGNVDAISRMKLTGDVLTLLLIDCKVSEVALHTGGAILRVLGYAAETKVLGTGVSTGGIATAIYDLLKETVIAFLAKIASYAEPLAFYFGVFLPSLPYGIFMITVVGWILAVLQTVIAAPLWAIMHMRPSQSFVGSDQQGYTLFLALFARPALAILGLFAAMLVANPIVDFIITAFFKSSGAVMNSNGLSPIAGVFQLFWWLTAFGMTMLPVLYMIFGLPQTLPDHVLRWISANVHDLGATHAASNMQSRVESAGVGAASRKIGNSQSTNGRRQLGGTGGGTTGSAPSGGGGGGGGGSSRGGNTQRALSDGGQGVAPSSASATAPSSGGSRSSSAPSASSATSSGSGRRSAAARLGDGVGAAVGAMVAGQGVRQAIQTGNLSAREGSTAAAQEVRLAGVGMQGVTPDASGTYSTASQDMTGSRKA